MYIEFVLIFFIVIIKFYLLCIYAFFSQVIKLYNEKKIYFSIIRSKILNLNTVLT